MEITRSAWSKENFAFFFEMPKSLDLIFDRKLNNDYEYGSRILKSSEISLYQMICEVENLESWDNIAGLYPRTHILFWKD